MLSLPLFCALSSLPVFMPDQSSGCAVPAAYGPTGKGHAVAVFPVPHMIVHTVMESVERVLAVNCRELFSAVVPFKILCEGLPHHVHFLAPFPETVFPKFFRKFP